MDERIREREGRRVPQGRLACNGDGGDWGCVVSQYSTVHHDVNSGSNPGSNPGGLNLRYWIVYLGGK